MRSLPSVGLTLEAGGIEVWLHDESDVRLDGWSPRQYARFSIGVPAHEFDQGLPGKFAQVFKFLKPRIFKGRNLRHGDLILAGIKSGQCASGLIWDDSLSPLEWPGFGGRGVCLGGRLCVFSFVSIEL